MMFRLVLLALTSTAQGADTTCFPLVDALHTLVMTRSLDARMYVEEESVCDGGHLPVPAPTLSLERWMPTADPIDHVVSGDEVERLLNDVLDQVHAAVPDEPRAALRRHGDGWLISATPVEVLEQPVVVDPSACPWAAEVPWTSEVARQCVEGQLQGVAAMPNPGLGPEGSAVPRRSKAPLPVVDALLDGTDRYLLAAELHESGSQRPPGFPAYRVTFVWYHVEQPELAPAAVIPASGLNPAL